jgi:UDP-glucose 4-epimerase
MNQSAFAGSTFLITGGTGSFGYSMLNRLLDLSAVAEIRILSRDEEKQDRLRKIVIDERVKFHVGDVRDYSKVLEVCRGVNYVFHAAALKQVPTGEFFPLEMVKTNILGSENVIRASIESDVKNLVCLSTDKAVYPINAMGVSKAMMERLAISHARGRMISDTKISVTRYGNVVCSRGSVIPRFIEQIKQGEELTITDPEMTRFLMSLDDAISLVFHSLLNSDAGDLHVMKAPATKVSILAEAIESILDKKRNKKVRIIGVRHGEKKHESLMSAEELLQSIDELDFFKVPIDSRGMRYEPYFVEGTLSQIPDAGFTSQNTRQLDLNQTIELLLSNREFLQLIEGER